MRSATRCSLRSGPANDEQVRIANSEFRIQKRAPSSFFVLNSQFGIRNSFRIMKVLVVEDSSSMRAYLTTIIEGGTESYDLEIVEAASGFEALKTDRKSTRLNS